MNSGLNDFHAGEADEDTRYVVIHVEGERLPHAVVRVTGTTEEAFTHDLVWGPSDLLSRVPAEPTWTTQDVEVGYANGFLVGMVREIRETAHGPESAEYEYFAVFRGTIDVLDLDRAYMLVRRSDRSFEEKYAGNLRWGSTDKLYRLSSGRDWTEECVAVSEVEAERLKRLLDERWAAFGRYHVITEGGRPVAVVRGAGETAVAFTGGSGWTSSDLLDRVAADPAWSVAEVDPQRANEHMAELVRLRREAEQAEFSAGYAVFRRSTDVLDLDSAHEVVQELGPGHEVAVPIDAREVERLGRRIFVRKAKRRVERTGAHEYFAVFNGREDVVDVDLAFSVIRRPVGENGPWEVFLRDGEWPPTRKPSLFEILPIDSAEVDRVTSRIVATGEPRYLAIRDDRGPVALVRLTGTTEDAAHDLGWAPSDLLGRLRDEPTWSVVEQTAANAEMSRFHGAAISRAVLTRSDEQQYFALFADVSDAFDLDNAVVVVRRTDGVDEEFVESGEWVPTDRLTRVERHTRELAISREEMERLTRRSRRPTSFRDRLFRRRRG